MRMRTLHAVLVAVCVFGAVCLLMRFGSASTNPSDLKARVLSRTLNMAEELRELRASVASLETANRLRTSVPAPQPHTLVQTLASLVKALSTRVEQLEGGATTSGAASKGQDDRPAMEGGGATTSGAASKGQDDRPATQNRLKLPPGAAVVVEIGLHNIVMLPRGANSFVLGVEASLKSIGKYLLSAVNGNPGVSIINAAVYEGDEMLVFQEMGGWPAASTLVVGAGLHKRDKKLFDITEWTPVATVTLQQLFDLIPPEASIDLLKVDVQGVDYNVLRSAGKSIRRARTIFTECTRDGKKDDTGMSGVEAYGNVLDLCSNIRRYLEGFGFVYLGHFIEAKTDVTGDMAFAVPDAVEIVKGCFEDLGGLMFKQADQHECVATKMYESRV